MDNTNIDNYNKLRDRFLKVYSNLPLSVREEIIYVVEEKGPINWNVAYLEIQSNTPLAKKILNRLAELEVI